jgi:predicted molibdopterin-dependent oxidoreductase YjgC
MSNDGLQFDGLRIVHHPILGAAQPARVITFTFDGHPVEAREGETVAAALLAAGVRVFRTMPRTGEPRGGYCFVGRCADCLMVVNGEPNVMACLTPVVAGMLVETQHGLGAWAADVENS